MDGDIWAGDLLDRQSDAKLLIQFLRARHSERMADGHHGSYVLNLNASWGQGKTYFLTRLAARLREQGHLVAFVNGWRDDASGEPLVAVMVAIEDALKPHFGTQRALHRMWDVAKASGGEALLAVSKGAVKRVLKKVIGEGVEEIVEIYQDADVSAGLLDIDSASVADKDDGFAGDASEVVTKIADRLISEKLHAFRRRNKSVDTFKSSVSALLTRLSGNNADNLPMFVLIDELDRCRPTYAIEMLEQTKHLFDIDEIVFIIATDTNQLSRTVGAVYGSEFDGRGYLLRFFNRQYKFPTPNTFSFVHYLFKTSGIDETKISSPLDDSHVAFITSAMEAHSLRLRDIEQCFDMLRSFITTWAPPTRVELLYLLPLIIAFQQGREEDFANLRPGTHAFEAPSLGQWQLQYDYYSEYRQKQRRSVNVMTLVGQMRSAAIRSLSEFGRDEIGGDNTPGLWLRDRMMEQFRLLYQNQYQLGVPALSDLISYPDRVQSLGRLSIEAPE